MKKILMTLAAVLCCAMISTIFTACNNSENDSVSDYAAYVVKVKSVISINSNCYDVEEQMRQALDKQMDGKMSGSTEGDKCICKRNDTKAISICDEAFKNANPSGHFIIVLQVTPFVNGLNNETTVLKLYENL